MAPDALVYALFGLVLGAFGYLGARVMRQLDRIEQSVKRIREAWAARFGEMLDPPL